MEYIARLLTTYPIAAPLAICAVIGAFVTWCMNRKFVLASPTMKLMARTAAGILLGILAGFAIEILFAKWLPANYPYGVIKFLLGIGTPMAAHASHVALNKIKRWRNK